jgi:UPF0042 nucleotide-binding protein
MELVIVTGLSGAGKSNVANCFEDMGYYCIDNLPPGLIENFVQLIAQRKSKIHKAAIVIDIRGGDFLDTLQENIEDLKGKGVNTSLLFVEASDEAILRRFSETRRKHPLADGISNIDALANERKRMMPLKKLADNVIDTSLLKAAEAATKIREIYSDEAGKGEFSILIQSFGFKYGIPQDADIVLDVRFIQNPFYVIGLKDLNGNDKEVSDFVMSSEFAPKFVQMIAEGVDLLSPGYIKEGKNSLNISIGCTGGQHRSVAMANEAYKLISKKNKNVTVKHRELG